MFNPTEHLTQREKDKLEAGSQLEGLKQEYGLKTLVEVLGDILGDKKLLKVGLRLTNNYYQREEMKNMANDIREVIEKYDDRYPTDKDLEE